MTLALAKKPKNASRGASARSTKPILNRKYSNRQFGAEQSNSVSNMITPTSRPTIQAKLKVGEPNDKYEQEADRVADMVMRMPDPTAVSNVQPINSGGGGSQIQRMCSDCEDEVHRKPLVDNLIQAKETPGNVPTVTPKVQAQINGLKGGGQPLPKSVRNFFEPRFGYDFSGVRIHTGSRAARSAEGLQARAYTLGQNVVFGDAQYQLNSQRSQRLLAHELTHVVQQRGGNNGFIRKSGTEQDSQSEVPACRNHLKEIMEQETRRRTNRAQYGRIIPLNNVILGRSHQAISLAYNVFLPNRSLAYNVFLPNGNPRVGDNQDITVYQPGNYPRAANVTETIAAENSIAMAALRHLPNDMFADCISSPRDEGLRMFADEMLTNNIVNISFVHAYELARFNGRTTSPENGGRPDIHLPNRARNMGHRVVHEMMHYYVHEAYRTYSESRPELTQVLMEGGAEFLTRHVINTQFNTSLPSDRNFTISTSVYESEFRELRDRVILGLSFDSFKQAYFNGRTDLLDHVLGERHVLGGRRTPLDEITMEAVTQATLNDCYLLAALASLAATSHGRQLLSESVRQIGVSDYSVRFFRNPETGVDMIPQWFTVHHQPRERGIVAPWVRVIEQAYAQLYPSYSVNENLQNGVFSEMGGLSGGTAIGGSARAFSHLTGRPGTMARVADSGQYQLWERITAALNSGRHVVAGTSRNLGDTNSASGIFGGHNYSVLRAFQCSGERSGERRWVRIRNPWGYRLRGNVGQPVFDLTFTVFTTNFSQIAISDFPNPNSQDQDNTNPCIQPQMQSKDEDTSTDISQSPKGGSMLIQRQLNSCSPGRRYFGSSVVRETTLNDGSTRREIDIGLNLYLEINLIEGLTDRQIQSFIVNSLNRRSVDTIPINEFDVHINWHVNWLGGNSERGRYTPEARVRRGLAIGVSVLPGDLFASRGIDGMSICTNGMHRIVINGDHVFEALNSRGQRRREKSNLFGNEISHEIGHSLGLIDLSSRSTVMHNTNSTDVRIFNGNQIREIVLALSNTTEGLPEWLMSEE